MPKRQLYKPGFTIQEMSAVVDTEQTFDQEFTVEELTKIIVDQAKADIKAKFGNKKRHRQ